MKVVIPYMRFWQLANPEKMKAYKRKYNHSLKAKIARARYARSEKGKANLRRYFESPKGQAYWREKWARRRAIKRKATIGERAKICRIYARAQELRQWFDVVVDHIVPLAKGGAHAAANLQIIYAFENTRKGMCLDYKPRVIFR